jgi:predicted N-formylglutamate amidohydrolase
VVEDAPPRPSPRAGLLLTCEHAGNRVPPRYRRAFKDAGSVLRSHRGWDPGALALARSLERVTGAPLVSAATTRLLIDLNRTPGNPSLYSRYTARLDPRERARIFDEHYAPHLARVRETLRRLLAAGYPPVVHVGVHSFTPVLRGVRRDVHVGLLFDPARPLEAGLCRAWREELARRRPRWKIALNRPYKGTDDGLTTGFRRAFEPSEYLGIELEVRHDLLKATGARLRRVHADLARSLVDALAAGLAPPFTPRKSSGRTRRAPAR